MNGRTVVIVEGLSDKRKLEAMIRTQVHIVTTNGTISFDRLEEFSEEFANDEVYVLVDSDKSGEQLRKKLKRALPLAKHLYVDKTYKEVATTPDEHLAAILLSANIEVDATYLLRK